MHTLKSQLQPRPNHFDNRPIEILAEFSMQNEMLVFYFVYPFVFGFSVYESFEGEEVKATGIASLPKKNEQCLGGHAVLAVGYDNTTNRFLVRNSWGDSWGIKGYFTLPYEYLLNENLSDDFWNITLIK